MTANDAVDARRKTAPRERGPVADPADVLGDVPWRRGDAASTAPTVYVGARPHARFRAENWRLLTVMLSDGRVEYMARVRA